MVDNLTKQKEEMAKFQEAEMLKHLDLKYKNEIIRSMEWLGEKEDTIFLGQSVKYSGNAMYNTTKTSRITSIRRCSNGNVNGNGVRRICSNYFLSEI
mgnify:CR=1 FL=1